MAQAPIKLNTIQLPADFRGTNTLLMGPTGTGKTHAFGTYVATYDRNRKLWSPIDNGMTAFAVFTEPGMETLESIPDERLHWAYIPPANPSWDNMIGSADLINSLSFKALSNLTDINKSGHNQFLTLLKLLANFKCDRCGREFGPVDKWGPLYSLMLDSASGLNIMAMDLVTGSKPVKAVADWGVAMDNEERLITKLTVNTSCWFTMIAHLEREVDEVAGGITLMAGMLGKKLAPRIPRFFSDVVLSVREGQEFFWDTALPGVDLKARNLPIGSKLPADFQTIVSARVQRALASAPTPQVPSPEATAASATAAS